MLAIDKKIEKQKRKIEALDERIGRLMSERVSMEDKLAELHEQKVRAA